jgi:hypothetical protein
MVSPLLYVEAEELVEVRVPPDKLNLRDPAAFEIELNVMEPLLTLTVELPATLIAPVTVKLPVLPSIKDPELRDRLDTVALVVSVGALVLPLIKTSVVDVGTPLLQLEAVPQL